MRLSLPGTPHERDKWRARAARGPDALPEGGRAPTGAMELVPEAMPGMDLRLGRLLRVGDQEGLGALAGARAAPTGAALESVCMYESGSAFTCGGAARLRRGRRPDAAGSTSAKPAGPR